MSSPLLNIAISSCLGLTSAVGLGTGGPTGGVRRIESIRFRIAADGYESPIDDEDEDVDALNNAADVRETFDVHFGVAFGGLSGEWVVKGLSLRGNGTGNEDGNGKMGAREGQIAGGGEVQPTTAAGWKAKFLDVQRRLWEKEEESRGLRERVLEVVL
jgi:hypothetical protein